MIITTMVWIKPIDMCSINVSVSLYEYIYQYSSSWRGQDKYINENTKFILYSFKNSTNENVKRSVIKRSLIKSVAIKKQNKNKKQNKDIEKLYEKIVSMWLNILKGTSWKEDWILS